jgi:hypothetical protein
LTVGYQFYRSTDRYTTSTGERYYDGHTRQHGLVGYFNYSITDRLAVSVGLPPYFLSSYNGPDPHRWPVFDDGSIATDSSGTALFLPPTIDDGSSHGSFQDLRGELSFLALEGSWVVTPFVGFQLPSHDYEYHAQTAVGRGLWDLRIGANVGRRLDPLLPEAYFHGRYAFAYRQATQDLRFNYSYVDLELGYFVTPSLSLRILGSSQIAHDGRKTIPLHGPKPDAYSLSQWLYVSSEDEQMRGQRPAGGLRHDQLTTRRATTSESAPVRLTPRVDVSRCSRRSGTRRAPHRPGRQRLEHVRPSRRRSSKERRVGPERRVRPTREERADWQGARSLACEPVSQPVQEELCGSSQLLCCPVASAPVAVLRSVQTSWSSVTR